MNDYKNNDQPTDSLAKMDEYDRLQHEYRGLPGFVKTGMTTIRVVPLSPLATVTTWIVQTIRANDLGGDLVFLDKMGGEPQRIVLPPQVTAAIARQRDSLTSKSRSRAARERAATSDASHLHDPAVRKRALATRKRKAAARRARRAKG